MNYCYNPRFSSVILCSIDVFHVKEFTTNLSEVFKELKENLKQAMSKQEKFTYKHRNTQIQNEQQSMG